MNIKAERAVPCDWLAAAWALYFLGCVVWLAGPVMLF